MLANHIKKRGCIYYYCCRVPTDLQPLFPSDVISRSLKTNSKKHAGVLRLKFEHKLQKLFLQLRSGMLDRTLQNHLVNQFLHSNLKDLESIATGQVQLYEDIIQLREKRKGAPLTDAEKQEERANIASRMAEHSKDALKAADPVFHKSYTDKVAKMLDKQHGIALTPADKQKLALEYENAAKAISEAEAGIYRGEWALFETLREKTATALSKPYAIFADVLEDYKRKYRADKPDIKQGTLAQICIDLLVLFSKL